MEEQLISEVEKRPVLYDKSLANYKNANYREEQWKEVTKALKNDAQKLPSGSGEGKKSKWSYYSIMTFLIPYIEFRETVGNYSNNSEISIHEENSSPVSEIESSNNILKTPEHHMKEQIEHNITLSNTNKSSSASKKRKYAVLEDKNDIDEKLLEFITKETDADEQFLLSHVAALKRMTPKQNAIAKMKIQQIMFDIEFGNQNNYYKSPPSNNSRNSDYSSTSTYYAPILTTLQTIKSSTNDYSQNNFADDGRSEYNNYYSP